MLLPAKSGWAVRNAAVGRNAHHRLDGAVERQVEQYRTSLELLAVVVVGQVIAPRRTLPLELDLPQHDLDPVERQGIALAVREVDSRNAH
jgi:hypothetical protein